MEPRGKMGLELGSHLQFWAVSFTGVWGNRNTLWGKALQKKVLILFAICDRPSVCLSVVYLSVCNVRAPYSGD